MTTSSAGDSTHAASENPDRTVLVFRDLVKTYGGDPVLRGISLALGYGEIIGLIGPSGAGKSTLLKCGNLLEQPDDGLVVRDGTIIGGRDPETGRPVSVPHAVLRRARYRTPMVFQHFNLFRNLSTLDNVVLAQRRVLHRSKEAAVAKATEVLERVGLANKLNAMPNSLSGGQQQRVGIARALALDPEVILMDEPTSSLDPELVGEVTAIIQDLAAGGMTMMIASHELSLIESISTRVYFLDGGVVRAQGTPRELFHETTDTRLLEFTRRFSA